VKSLSECRLYTFVDSAYLHGRDPLALTRQLCEGGSDLIQLRAKDWPPERILKTAERMVEITRDFGVHLVINDHPGIARAVGAELCHLGQEDFFDAGRLHTSDLGCPVGLSTHAPEQARRAIAADPAYIAIGPVYATGTKPTAKPVTLDYVRWAAQNVSIPWFAIGGITLANIQEVLAAGGKRVCIVSAILNREDVAAACAQFKAMLRTTKARRDEL
jgi:thiamine-phosphate pyrophosphorylase